ncbi:MAG: hypothetical protein CMA86_01910 [Euryarchaeota archaeon]|nr:hypothetical protein [Euryarchaeota archaeon]
MNRVLAVLLGLMLVLSGCLGGEDVIDNDTEPEPVLLDTDGDGVPDVDDDDDDGDTWTDIDELNCESDSLLASSVPSDVDNDGVCDTRDNDKDGDTWSNIDEEACGTDPLLASDMPTDGDEDGVCDALDEDTDGDAFADGIETQCGSDPLDVTSIPADMDGDGICDALDDDKDGDGVNNDDDFAPEDPDKSEGTQGCTDEAAFNYNQAAEVDDDSCFTLADAEAAVMTAMTGIVSSTFNSEFMDGVPMTMTMVLENENMRLVKVALTADNGEEMSVSYLVDGNGFVQVEQIIPADEEEGTEAVHDLFLVNDAYYAATMGETGWSHCEFDGDAWYCVDLFDEDDNRLFNADSQSETYHVFECNDGSTIVVSDVNDGRQDCADGSDEPMMQDDGRTYQCNDGTTVSFSVVNDGEEDCADGSDEPVFIDSFTCNDGDTILGQYVNDGHEDCHEGEDEPYYDFESYETSTFLCDDGTEILFSYVNDGHEDCTDGEDEPEYVLIERSYFDCADGSTSIDLSSVNDGVADCPDSSDEDDGTGTQTYDCLYTGDTIDFAYVNDGDYDCEDETDEPYYDEEPTGVFVCDDGEEISFEFVNDGYDDCSDGSDEATYDIDELTDFTCDDGSVIAFSAANDGHDDCPEGEDEPVYEEVEYTSFECASGDMIPLSWVNDGTDDCPAGDDEPSYDPVTQSELSTYECLFSGETIALSLVNDDQYDCDDGTDEPEYENVDTSEWTCDDGSDTFGISHLNDGDRDCSDGSDEAQFDIEDENSMLCLNGDEIAVSQFNDGHYDCSDGSDEEDYWQCDDGSYTIPFSYINDGWEICEDGSDESVVEDTNIIDCFGQDGSTVLASEFHDGWHDCDNGWDEMDFDQENDCEWEAGKGWMCTSAMFPTDETYQYWEGADENGRAVIGLNATDDDGSSMVALFDASTHAFLTMQETEYNEDGELESAGVITTEAYDASIAEMIVVDTDLDVHAPPFALIFDGESMPGEDDRVFTCNDGTEVPFSYVNDGEDDCSEGEDEPVYEMTEYSEFYCSADDEFIPLSWVNDGEDDCSDGEDEDDGTGTQTYTCWESGETIAFEYVNDGDFDCEDESDEPYYDEEETSEWECEDGSDIIPLSWVNDGGPDCGDGSDESPTNGGHGYGGYGVMTMGIAESMELGQWSYGEGTDMIEIVFMNCASFDEVTHELTYNTYLLPSDCGEELARYSLSEVMDGNVVGMFASMDEGQLGFYVDEDFELEGWNTVRLSTPNGEYADENPEVVLPAPGVGFALVAMLGAAMLAGRRDE